MELAVRVEGEHLGPVHDQQIGHERGVVVQDHGIGIGELLAEDVLVHARQAGGQGLHVAGKHLVLQRAAGAVGLHDDGVQLVELEGLGKIVQLAGKGHHGKARQVLVFEHVVVERGQKLAAFHQRVAFVLLIGLDQAEADMHGVEEALELVKARDGHRPGCRIGILPVKAVLAEDLLPLDHMQPATLPDSSVKNNCFCGEFPEAPSGIRRFCPPGRRYRAKSCCGRYAALLHFRASVPGLWPGPTIKRVPT